eukprot:3106977-Rhodomonas_salina.1
MARDMVEVKRSLSALAQSSAPTAGGAAAAAPTAQRTAHVQTLTKTNADPYMNRNAPWGYQVHPQTKRATDVCKPGG